MPYVIADDLPHEPAGVRFRRMLDAPGVLQMPGAHLGIMVKAIVEENGERMLSSFGYVGWAVVFLVPLFVLVTLIFF